ncbi:hypothetical protein M409DRAFT_55861 [Zasmidium cellare ATCC 36951]|uniref:BTB domain-containing protein n=1 Tax=Zasmidium cellare ATCC 36951 TaxID=1080233 RepID=A0A6A6CFP7_ZASCE|nr:uncharacterized protein M409DRAFT_55861 [Zasmidium cellare ATCC 36951]KAF2165473.1 hypothetical protein M409DRAFT_55861 [Zasmidium cellare ATCC 36951]
MAQAPVERAIGVAKLLTNPVYSDFTLEYGDQKWKLHRIVLSTQSSFFATAFKEIEEEQEGAGCRHTDRIRGCGRRHAAVPLHFGLLRHFHLLRRTLRPPAHRVDVLVYTLAVAVDIPPLAEKAASKFCKHTETDWATPGFAQAVRALYEQAPNSRTMRRVAVMTAARHAQELLHESYGTEFRAVVKECKAFGADAQIAAIARQKGLGRGTG